MIKDDSFPTTPPSKAKNKPDEAIEGFLEHNASRDDRAATGQRPPLYGHPALHPTAPVKRMRIGLPASLHQRVRGACREKKSTSCGFVRALSVKALHYR